MKKVLQQVAKKAVKTNRKQKLRKRIRRKNGIKMKRTRRTIKFRKRLLRKVKKRTGRRTSKRNTHPVKQPPPALIDVPLVYEPVDVPQATILETKPRLSVIAPILNEEKFLPLFLESVASYADEILILDGGSTDASVRIINEWKKRANIRLFHKKQTGLPYSDDWNESVVRNFLVDQAVGDWIMAIDADEMIDDGFRNALPRLMAQKETDAISFPWVQFWMNPQTIRINAANDNHWSVNKYFMWRNHIGIRYDDAKNHCKLQLFGRYMWEIPNKVEPIPVYHYHYAFGSRVKANDNRRRDVDQYLGKPTDRTEYDILTKPFTGKHPAIMKKYFAEMKEKGNMNGSKR
ncbi:glycosyltransferase [Paenibacillus aestuarii]|uniref:Glycosyltransferase n=1 Tax=Paenibacillus aestuarii TaxID=516965 RepID=A0ABW0KH58_9BACL|nr:glycosyltransferase [Paenibacillus aestuarii]